jgi:hypothetical protein
LIGERRSALQADKPDLEVGTLGICAALRLIPATASGIVERGTFAQRTVQHFIVVDRQRLQ